MINWMMQPMMRRKAASGKVYSMGKYTTSSAEQKPLEWVTSMRTSPPAEVTGQVTPPAQLQQVTRRVYNTTWIAVAVVGALVVGYIVLR